MSTHKIGTPGNLGVYAHDETGRLMDAYGFTVKCCGKCGGHGTLSGYEFSDGARCWGCNRQGYRYTNKALVAQQQFISDMKARKAVNIDAYWKASGSKVEADVAEKLRAQVDAYNTKVSA